MLFRSVRSGDVLASLLVLTGQLLGFRTATFAAANALLTMVWLAVAQRLSARHQQLTATAATAPAPALVPAKAAVAAA